MLALYKKYVGADPTFLGGKRFLFTFFSTSEDIESRTAGVDRIFKVQTFKRFVNCLHGVLNMVEKNRLYKWTVNRETNLMNLIRL